MEDFLNAFFEQKKPLLIQKKLFEQETLNELKAKRIEGGPWSTILAPAFL